MTDNTANSRIARNSIYMTIRMCVVLLLSLYTTRIILNTLGVEDYGIYNVVCGFVSMFAFLNTSMSNGIQRYYNYELSKNGESGAHIVFSSSLVLQAILAAIVILFAESLGIWYINNYMIIPDDRIIAAKWIFQLSVISFVIIILQAPFSAAVMAHERMDFYAFVSILDTILKLCIALLLPSFFTDKLIVYALLLLFISIFDLIIYIAYCALHFSEIKMPKAFRKSMISSMLGFSGWNIFGTLSGVLKEQGINLIMNLFCGPVVNAAKGVATQVSSGLQSFVGSITIPVRPQVIQSYAISNYTRTMNLTYSISKVSCLFLYLMALPIIAELHFVMSIWLGDVIPEHTLSFIIIVILTSFINNLNSAIAGVVHASGKMRTYQLCGAFVNILALPIAFIAMKCGAEPELALLTVLIITLINQCVCLVIMKTIISYSLREYFKRIFPPIFLVIITTIWIPCVLHH